MSWDLYPFDAAYGWALEHTTSFVKVLAGPGSRLPPGAQHMTRRRRCSSSRSTGGHGLDNTVDEVASGALYIHPALTEVAEQAPPGL